MNTLINQTLKGTYIVPFFMPKINIKKIYLTICRNSIFLYIRIKLITTKTKQL